MILAAATQSARRFSKPRQTVGGVWVAVTTVERSAEALRARGAGVALSILGRLFA